MNNKNPLVLSILLLFITVLASLSFIKKILETRATKRMTPRKTNQNLIKVNSPAFITNYKAVVLLI